MNAPYKRLRITFSQTGVLKYLSHLDMIRTWERLLRRARIPLAYSHGFTPHPKISVASPLPVGFEGLREILEITLTEELTPGEFLARVQPFLPSGLDIIAVKEASRSRYSLQQRVMASEYEVRLLDCGKCAELAERVRTLLERDSIPWRKEKKGRVREYNLRPLIKKLEVRKGGTKACILWMLLQTHPDATARPEEVLEALGVKECDWEIKRVRLYLVDEEETYAEG